MASSLLITRTNFEEVLLESLSKGTAAGSPRTIDDEGSWTMQRANMRGGWVGFMLIGGGDAHGSTLSTSTATLTLFKEPSHLSFVVIIIISPQPIIKGLGTNNFAHSPAVESPSSLLDSLDPLL